jgi:hypothetical protein
MAENIVALLANRDIRTRLGRANSQQIATHFSVTRMGHAYASLIAAQLEAAPAKAIRRGLLIRPSTSNRYSPVSVRGI